MLSVRVAAALVRNLPRRAGFVSNRNFLMLMFLVCVDKKTIFISLNGCHVFHSLARPCTSGRQSVHLCDFTFPCHGKIVINVIFYWYIGL